MEVRWCFEGGGYISSVTQHSKSIPIYLYSSASSSISWSGYLSSSSHLPYHRYRYALLAAVAMTCISTVTVMLRIPPYR